MVLLQPITFYELLSLIISVAGFATVVITLALLIRQTRDMTAQTKYVAQSLESSIYSSGANQMLAVDEMFINHPELRPYFYSGNEIRGDDPAYDKVIAVAEYLLDFFSSVHLHMQHFPQIFPREPWEAFMVDVFANSPVLCGYLESVKEWYADEVVALMRAGEARRQKSGKQNMGEAAA